VPAVELDSELEQQQARRYAGLGFYRDDPDQAAEALKPKLQSQSDSFWDVLTSGVWQGAGVLGVPVLYDTGAGYAGKGWGSKQINPGFDPFKYVPNEFKEQFAPEYFWANTPDEVEQITARLRLKIQDDDRLKRNGFGGLLARLGGGLIDPINLLPAGGVVKTATGVSLLKSALVGAAVNGGVMAVSEAAQQASQMRQDYGEAATSIAGSAAIGALLGTLTAGGVVKTATGVSLLKSALVGAAVNGGVMAVSEAAQQASQMRKDYGEAATSIAGSAVIGALLGTGGAAIAKRFGQNVDTLGQKLENQMMVPATIQEVAPNLPASQYGVKPAAKSAEASAGVIADALQLSDERRRLAEKLNQVESRLTNKAGTPDVADAQRALGTSINQNRQRLVTFQGMIEAAPDDATRKSLSRQIAKVAAELGRDERLLQDVLARRANVTAASDLLTPVKRSELNPSTYTPDPTIDLLEPNAIPIPETVMQMDRANPMAHETAVFTHMSDVLYDRLGLDKVKDEALIQKLWLLKDQDPVLRTILSPSTEVRNIVQDLVETPLKYEKNYKGIPTALSVESVARQGKGLLGQAFEEADSLYAAMRLGGQTLNPAEWRQAISKALRRGDQHAIPEVAKAAQAFRRLLFDPFKKRAEAIGALPENVAIDTADSYLSRVYDREKIVARRPEFEQINYEWLAIKNQMLESGQRRTDAQLRQVAQQITDRIVAQHDGRLPYDLMDGLSREAAELLDARRVRAGMEPLGLDMAEKPVVIKAGKSLSTGTGSPFKRRVYDIPDERVEEFLVNDAYLLARKYERTMSVDVALMEKMGTPDLDEALRKLQQSVLDDYARLREGVTDAKTLKGLDARQKQDSKDLLAMWQRLRGVYGIPKDTEAGIAKVGRVLGAVNYMRLMGNVMISSLADAARPMMVHGVSRYVREGLLPLVTEFKAAKVSMRETQLAGTAWDLLLDTRMAALADFVDEFGGNSRLDRMLDAGQSAMGRLSGISWWTQAGKQFAGMMTQTRILDVAEQVTKGKPVSEKELAFLASNYIDRDMASRIVGQFQKHGETHGTVRIANTGLWDDMDAVTVFRAGLGKEVDKIIVTPGQDKPLLLSTWWGKMLGQFKSFFFASTQRVMLSGLQDRDLGTLAGLVMATGLGMGSVLLTDLSKFNSPDKKPREYEPAELVLEGLDRSGAVGWLFDVNNAVESLSRGHYGLSPILGKEPMSRYRDRNVSDALLGPTAGLSDDVMKVGRAMTTGDFRRTDVRAMRRLLPFQNLFYTRWLFDQGERGLNSFLGADEEEN
jgi:hypothetical protein